MRPTKTPRTWQSGTEPMTARSDLKLRFLLSVIFTPLFFLATVGFSLWAALAEPDGSPRPATLVAFAFTCGLLTLFAVADLLVVLRRRRTEL